jgi:hypothetical protein
MSRFAAAFWLSAVWLIPVVGFFQPVARADTLTPTESAYVQAYGGDVCAALDKFHTISGVVSVVKGVVNSGFTPDQAVTVVNVAVATYCPANWALPQQTGAYFRDQQKGQRV